MTLSHSLCATALFGLLVSSSARAEPFVTAPQAGSVFASLPAGVVYPEGIAVDLESGDVFVSTADFTFKSGPSKLLRFDCNGRLEATRELSTAPSLGVAVDAGYVYFTSADALVGGTSRIRRLPVDFTAETAIEDLAAVPNVGPPEKRTVLNADKSTDSITFGSNGASLPNGIAIARSELGATLYFSDSFQGAIFSVYGPDHCTLPCPAKLVSHDPLLATAGHAVGVGANGLALDASGSALFIANLGDDRIVKLELDTRSVSVFVEDIARPDGIALDAKGRLWVCSVTNNELVIIGPDARVLGKLGSYRGLDPQGRVTGLLGPASLALGKAHVLVTNYVFPVLGTYLGADVVKTFTIARVPLPPTLR